MLRVIQGYIRKAIEARVEWEKDSEREFKIWQ